MKNHRDQESQEADESLKAYADELARDAAIDIDDNPRRYNSTQNYTGDHVGRNGYH